MQTVLFALFESVENHEHSIITWSDKAFNGSDVNWPYSVSKGSGVCTFNKF